MNRYELQATLNKQTKTIRFSDTDDIQAMYTGIFRILDKAKRYTTWSHGYISLTNLTTGELVKEMASKQ
jgi:hypothetical protein